MWSYLIGFASFVLMAMLKMCVFRQWKILSGSADILLLFVVVWCLYDRSKRLWLLIILMAGIVSIISALPFYIPLIVYFFIYQLSRLLQTRIMQSPLLGIIVLTFAATLLQVILNLAYLFILRTNLAITSVLIEVALPSILLNMLLAIPMYAIVRELAYYAFPKGVEA